MKTLIIDDDPQSHKVLGRLLGEAHPDIVLTEGATSVEEGLRYIAQYQPELVFLDVELPDGLGFDLMSRLGTVDFQVIFITAFNQYAISAIRFGALDFLLKPIDKDDLAEALNRARANQQERVSRERLELLVETYEKAQEKQLPSRLTLVNQSDILYLKVQEIMRLEARQVYTMFHVQEERQPLVSSLNLGKYVEQFLPYPTFVQTHRSHLINLSFVKKYVKGDRLAVMEDGQEIPVSRRFLDEFLAGMKEI